MAGKLTGRQEWLERSLADLDIGVRWHTLVLHFTMLITVSLQIHFTLIIYTRRPIAMAVSIHVVMATGNLAVMSAKFLFILFIQSITR